MISFQEKVYKVVSRIPKGKVMTYKAVAKAAGSPRAFRAVGSALNKNPNPLIVPCHRVIKSNGEIGGYRGGKNKKISLLKREGVKIRSGKVI
jgi:methylated-DNA-[protein]-cysteine S-methyltransferase